ncbi:MAG: lipid-binding SYLF domain-containing protein [Proteobacteria bacterium]|nr:lipid-binding SYLF domain-containing protein [Pseudomonadota bacterium]
MKTFAKLAAAAALAAAFFAAPAQAADTRQLLAHANATVTTLRHDSVFGDARHNLRRARAVLIFPSLVKGGFIFGAEGGDGVLLARTRHGWSSPAFYSMGSASFGFQAGLQDAQVVMIIMTDRALRAVERSKFKFGAGAGLTVVTLGAGVEGATSGNLTGDIIVWSKSKGVYGGISINGSVVAPQSDTNARFYGRDVSVKQILANAVRNPASRRLQTNLDAAF